MKNILNILSRENNLTPREKFLLLVKNDTQKAKTGKDMLTEADKEALENWHAKTSEEAREWNQLNEGWKYGGRMDIEAEFAYKDAQVAYLSQLPIIVDLLYYPGDRRMGSCIDGLKRLKKVTIDEAVAIAQKQKAAKLSEGLDFEYAVYQLAFELLSDDDKKSMKALYEDVEFDHQYLDQEEIIAHLYHGRKTLSREAKEKLAELVAEQSYNGFAKEYQLFHYFACIPVLEVARYYLKHHGIEIAGAPMPKNQEAQDGDEDTHNAVMKAMQKYAEEHGITIKAMLREACLRWIDEDLLEEYLPLAASNSADLLERWFGSKGEARKILLKHVQSGELAFRDRTDKETRKEKLYSKGLGDREAESARMALENFNLKPILKGELDEKVAFETFSDRVITGESLYAFTGNYRFVKEFKKRVDTYDANLGLVYAESDPEQKGEHLDQELLICDLTDKGEAAPFSFYGINMTLLSSIFRGHSLFEEFRKNGKLWIRFKNAEIQKTFMERRQTLMDGYANLLAIEGVFKKLSPMYEIDMAEHVSGRLATVREFIEQYNQAVRTATNTDDKSRKSKNTFLQEKEEMLFEDDIVIDIDAIEPNHDIVGEHEAKLRGIFPVFGDGR
ncbi:MAG: hypothetical protein ABSF47_00345 [Minisyncoccia bacterium]|jgi:hypothetical protein